MSRVDSDELRRFAAALLTETGADEAVAEAVAASLVAADLRGHPSHGVNMIPTYVEWSEAGGIEPTARPTTVADEGSTLLVDGNHGLGHFVGRRATELAAERAVDHPVVTVGIRRATHLGRIGWFAEQTAAAGLGFVGFTNMTSGEPVAPAGSAQRRFGTNPLTFGLPSFEALPYPVLLDVATSQVAFGKINVRHRAGEPIDPAWTVTDDGGSVPDADAFNEDGLGALAPLGGEAAGYKGTGLMLIAELFAATWSDSPVTPQEDARYENAAVFTVFDPLAFTTREAHEARLLALRDYLEETEYAPAVSAGAGSRSDRAYLPGRQEHVTRREYEAEGLPVADPVLETLVALARERGIAPDLTEPVAPES